MGARVGRRRDGRGPRQHDAVHRVPAHQGRQAIQHGAALVQADDGRHWPALQACGGHDQLAASLDDDETACNACAIQYASQAGCVGPPWARHARLPNDSSRIASRKLRRDVPTGTVYVRTMKCRWIDGSKGTAQCHPDQGNATPRTGWWGVLAFVWVACRIMDTRI